jgi:tetratricopeptide (TPR) repeat protein
VRGGRNLWAALAVAAIGLAGSAAVLSARDARFPAPPLAERLLYLRSGRVADRVMLQFDAVAADVYWIRTIQHYGRDLRSSRPDRFGLLEPLLDLTTTLDPHFNVAYRFGAFFLASPPPYGPGRVDQAVALLEKGLGHNPGRWQYAHDIAFVHYWFSGDYLEAARWFDRAADMPGAPEWILPLAAVTRLQGGDRTGARLMLSNLASSTDNYVKAAAERGLLQLQALDAIDDLEALVETFARAHGRYPASWAELFPEAAGKVPVDPTEIPYQYDPSTHAVTLSADSRLNPLPLVPRAR